MEIKRLEYYWRLPYTLAVQPFYEEGRKRYWIAEYLELRGCKTDGRSEHEAIDNVRELFDDYILMMLENKEDIPEPARAMKIVQDIVIVDTSDPQETGVNDKPEELEVNMSEMMS